jgi:ketosteroid isomerase-like protein
MRTIGIVLATLLVILAAGCQQAVNPSAERDAIREVERAGINAANKGDINTWLAAYTANATLMPPAADPVKGRVSMEAWGKIEFTKPGFALKYENDQTELSKTADMGYTMGRYELTVNDDKGNPVVERGKYVRLFRKQTDGAWKCTADMWNAAAPPEDES